MTATTGLPALDPLTVAREALALLTDALADLAAASAADADSLNYAETRDAEQRRIIRELEGRLATTEAQLGRALAALDDLQASAPA